MIREFENWILISKLSPDVIDSFRESVMCYKVGAYKSAFLMAYIGMQSVLRERVLNADYKPPMIPERMWNEKQSKLMDEDVWDSTISDSVKMKSPDRVFLLSDSLVSQYEALRTIRNICAHGKQGKVGTVQVEFLWDFIISYNHLFVVNGGVDGVRTMVQQHFDRTITPPDADPSNIIKNIQLALHGEELSKFIDWLYIESQKCYYITGPCFDKHNKYINIWDKLYECGGEIREAIIKYVKEQRFEEVVYFIDRYESSLDEIINDPVVARKLWTDDVICNGFSADGAWRILERLISGDMIPEAERSSFYQRLYKSVSKYFPKERIELLSKTDYFDRFRKAYIDHNNYTYSSGGINAANAYEQLFIRYVKEFGLDIESVKSINEIFSFATYGSFYDAIIKLMKDDNYLNQYKQICIDNGITDISDKF